MRIGCVVLAAGDGRRFGSNKLEARVAGESMIYRALGAVPSGLDTVVVSQYPEILSLAESFGFSAVRSGSPACGMSYSIRSGLSQLSDCRGVLFLVADQPWLKRDSVEALVALWAQNPNRVAGLAHGGNCGAPCIFPARLFPVLMKLTGDTDIGAVVRQLEETPLLLETDACELTDVDTPEVLKRAEASVQEEDHGR